MMDAVTDPTLREIWVKKSAQIGWTEILNNVVGYHVDQDPCPILMVQPTLQMGEAWSKDRLAPMVRDTPALRDKIRDPKSRDSGNTLMHKTFPGGHITVAGANSPASLASRPVRLLLVDEASRVPASAGQEGDPIALGRKRTVTFWNRKLLAGSTPTVEGACRVSAGYDNSDQRQYFVPCPHCGVYQVLAWSHVKWIGADPQTAHYVCDACDAEIYDGDKLEMLRAGEWRPTAEGNPGIAGFHIWEAYSPWVSFAELVASFLEMKKLPETLQTFVNTSLGETWEEAGEQVEYEQLFARRESYDVPEAGLVITCAADVQDDRIELETVIWGEGEECWSLDYRVIYGDVERNAIWDDLDDALKRTWTHPSGVQLHAAAVCIDSGYKTSHVYDFCRNKAGRRIYPTKGVGGPSRPIISAPVRKKAGKRNKGIDLFTIGTDEAKGVILSRLKMDQAGPGYMHFPDDRDEEYFLQLTAEKAVTRFRKGFAVREWIKVRRRNEALDLCVGNLAAIKLLNPIWPAIAKALGRKAGPKTDTPKRNDKPKRRLSPYNRPGGGFVKGWKR